MVPDHWGTVHIWFVLKDQRWLFDSFWSTTADQSFAEGIQECQPHLFTWIQTTQRQKYGNADETDAVVTRSENTALRWICKLLQLLGKKKETKIWMKPLLTTYPHTRLIGGSGGGGPVSHFCFFLKMTMWHSHPLMGSSHIGSQSTWLPLGSGEAVVLEVCVLGTFIYILCYDFTFSFLTHSSPFQSQQLVFTSCSYFYPFP